MSEFHQVCVYQGTRRIQKYLSPTTLAEQQLLGEEESEETSIRKVSDGKGNQVFQVYFVGELEEGIIDEHNFICSAKGGQVKVVLLSETGEEIEVFNRKTDGYDGYIGTDWIKLPAKAKLEAYDQTYYKVFVLFRYHTDEEQLQEVAEEDLEAIHDLFDCVNIYGVHPQTNQFITFTIVETG